MTRDAIVQQAIVAEGIRQNGRRACACRRSTTTRCACRSRASSLGRASSRQHNARLGVDIAGAQLHALQARRGRARRGLLAARLHELLRPHDRRGHQRDPAQHPGRARARPGEVEVGRREQPHLQTPPKDFGFGPTRRCCATWRASSSTSTCPWRSCARWWPADHEAVYERGERARWDEGLWKQIVELGWPGLAVPEEAGGVGFKMAGIAGAGGGGRPHALPSPLVATLNASFVLRAAGGEVGARLAGAHRRRHVGERSRSPTRGELGAGRLRRERARGRRRMLHFSRAPPASCRTPSRPTCWLVSARRATGSPCSASSRRDAAGLTLSSQDHIHDLTRDQATVRFDERARPAAENVVSEDGAGAALERAWPSMLVTGRRRPLRHQRVAAADHGRVRPRAQAVRSPARLLPGGEAPAGRRHGRHRPRALAALPRRLLHRRRRRRRGVKAARMAKSAASDAGAFISDRSVQLHGGIGFTWECDVHLFFKRSMHNQALYGLLDRRRRARESLRRIAPRGGRPPPLVDLDPQLALLRAHRRHGHRPVQLPAALRPGMHHSPRVPVLAGRLHPARRRTGRRLRRKRRRGQQIQRKHHRRLRCLL